MYLEHFGLNEPPFKVTPVTDFFFSGANRGEILDALVYAITDGEGIVKVSGEVGSGKTMLCRMLLDRLPTNLKAIYLANPSLSRDELLYAIADRLGLDLEGQRVNVILQNLQNDLEAKYARGERCVVLVDEAHAMPPETLEELRLLYNLQVGKHKLLQIVLFGQPELDEKLAQSNMRQLKDRIVHHFTILPLSQKVIHTYLMFRMRAAGYKGPDNFTSAAEKLIGKASQGLMRRVNILADKSLLAAFVENTHAIEVRHVQAAIRDSEMMPTQPWFSRKNIGVMGAVALLAAMLLGAGWFIGHEQNGQSKAVTSPVSAIAVAPTSSGTTQAMATTVADLAPSGNEPAGLSRAETAVPTSGGNPPPHEKAFIQALATVPKHSLLKQRLDAARGVLNTAPKGSASIQLYYTENTQPERMEGFLQRAKKLGKLDEIYVLPIKLQGRDAYRALYGVYADSNAAGAGMTKLPQRYQEAFTPTLYLLDDARNIP